MINLGKVSPGATIYIPFESFASSTGAPITITGLAVADIKIYKDGSTTERASTSGFTLLDTDGIDFDGITGIHGFSIDLSDNTTADFYASGSRYIVVVSAITVDSQTMSFVAAVFSIGEVGAILDTTIATLTTQTSFTLTTGPADNNALVGCVAVIHDAASAIQQAIGVVSAYTGSTKTVTLLTDPAIFTMAAKDNISFLPDRSLKPAVDNRNLVIDTSGVADANVTKLLGTAWLTPGTAGTPDVNAKLVGGQTASAAGAVTFPGTIASTTNITAGVITTTTNVTTVNGLAAGVITATSIAPDAIGASELASDAITEIRDAITGGAYALSTDSNGRIRIVDGTGAGEIDTSSGSVSVFDFTTAAKALLESEALDALKSIYLDHLFSISDAGATVANNSFWSKLLSKSATAVYADFDNTTDSLQALRDRGDAAWTTPVGFSTHTAADVWAVATRLLTAGTNIALAKGTGVTGFNDITAAAAATAVWTDLLAGSDFSTLASIGKLLKDDVDAAITSRSSHSAADVWASSTRTLSALGFTLGASDLATDTITAAKLATDAVQEIRNAITGGAYAIDTDANGRVRIVDGTAAGEIDTVSGAIAHVVLTDTATTVTNQLTAAQIRSALGLASANLDTQLDALPTAAENAAALLDLTDGIETGVTPRKALRALAAVLVGRISNAGTGTEDYLGIGVATQRVEYTVDASGNRTAITLSL